MKKSYQTYRNGISMDDEISQLRDLFEEPKDTRAPNISHTLDDILMSGYAMFSLKYSSLLSFEQQNKIEQGNLSRIYGIKTICSYAQQRKVLDSLDPKFIRDYYPTKFGDLGKAGLLKEYKFKIGSKHYLISSCDGVQHFSSKEICCDKCLTKHHKDGSVTYHHNLLCCALVHPDKREVFILDAEPILREDGSTKNDCESRSFETAKRLFSNIEQSYEPYLNKYDFLVVEAALYANEPHFYPCKTRG